MKYAFQLLPMDEQSKRGHTLLTIERAAGGDGLVLATLVQPGAKKAGKTVLGRLHVREIIDLANALAALHGGGAA